jgi:lipoprotein-anchoring transpeptidase ErfK/SrfK
MKGNGKTIWHYCKIYLLSIFIGIAVFITGSFLKFQPDCANSKTCDSDLIVDIDNDAIGTFQGHKVIPPKVNLSMGSTKPSILGVYVSNAEKHIYVDLSTQTLYAYQGDEKIMQTLISSGKWGRTPVGNFSIWAKVPVTRMAGGKGSDAYDLPNVQWAMFFYKDFGLHTAYWHNNFGYPMSHGCVNMRLVDAQKLYDWVDKPSRNQKGTAVSICDKFKDPGICTQNNPIN